MKKRRTLESLCVLVLLTLVASASFAQVSIGSPAVEVSSTCPAGECHAAPVFMGQGGFVGEAADGIDEVTFVVKCGMGTMRGSVEPDSNGIVRQLLTMANGLSCDESDGSLEIHGLIDGGWYWINDDVNSAVAPLLAKDTLGNMKTTPTDPGGVTLTATDHGTFVKHEASGRVGIISHILPMPEVEAEMADVCGPKYSGGKYVAGNADCMLGDGKTKITLMRSAGDDRMVRITNGMVTRSGDEDEDVTVTFNLWGNGSGHLSDEPLKGWDMNPRSPHKAMSLPADFDVKLLDLPGVTLEEAGITLQEGDVTVTTKKRVAAVAEDLTTPRLENGYYQFTTNVQHQAGPSPAGCKQAVLAGTTKPLWQAVSHATGELLDKPIATTDGPKYDGSISGYPNNVLDVWSKYDTWVKTYNSGNDPAIRTFRTVLYTDGSQTAIRNIYLMPMVVCEMEDDVTTYKGSIEISSPSDLCKAGNNTTAQLQVYAPLAAAKGKNEDVVPPLVAGGKVSDTEVAAIARLDVRCAPASANRGRELVPGDPFPVSDE